MRRLALWLLTLFAFAVPWEYSLDLGEPLGNIARIFGALTWMIAIPSVLENGSIRRPSWLQWLVLVFFLFFVTSYLWSVDGDATAEKMRSYFQVMGVTWLTWEFANDSEDLRGLLRAFVAGCWVLALLTFADFSSASAVAAEQIRFVAQGQDPNDVARFLDLGFPLAALLFCTEPRWWVRTLALGYVPAGLLAVLLTASRGGFSASLVSLGGCALLLVMWRPRGACGVIAGLSALAGGAWLLIPAESLDRLATIPEQIGSADLNDRLSIWTSGWHAFAQSPWVGYGAGTYSAASRLASGDTAHNTIMAVLVTGGLVGLGLFLAILLVTGSAVAQTEGLLRVSLATAFAVWIVTSMVGSVEENRTTWLLFGLMGLAGRLQEDDPGALRKIFSFSSSERRSGLRLTTYRPGGGGHPKAQGAEPSPVRP